MKRIALFVAVLFLGVLLSGCMPTAGGGDSEGAQTYLKGAVVKGFPAIPRYPKSQIVESYNFNSNLGASFISSDSLEKVVDFYSQSLPKLGWEQNLFRKSDTNYIFEVKNTKFFGSVVVNTASDGKRSAISFWLFPRN